MRIISYISKRTLERLARCEVDVIGLIKKQIRTDCFDDITYRSSGKRLVDDLASVEDKRTGFLLIDPKAEYVGFFMGYAQENHIPHSTFKG